MKPIHKFNNGRGATLCHQCSVIITTGLTDDLYCEECKDHRKKLLIEIMKEDEDLGLYIEQMEKEEPKQETENIKNFKKLVSDEISPAMKDFIKEKQETLEEASETAWNLYEHVEGNLYSTSFKNGFKLGAEWQQERMYSEEEAGELVYNIIGEYAKQYGIMIDGAKLNDLFKQFKKK